MKTRGKSATVVLILNILLCAAIIVSTATCLDGWGALIPVVLYCVSSVGIVAGIVLYILNKPALLKSAFVLVACVFIFAAAICILSVTTDIGDYPTDAEKIDRLTSFIRSTGNWGMAFYVLLQVLQVVILPLPAAVCYIPGAQIWGALAATGLASLGVLIGSLICYFLGRLFGRRVVEWIAGKETTDKYASYIAGKGKVIFVLMQILPFFPDDILCLIAGLTFMNFPFFLVVMVLVRPLIIAAYCFLGSGTVIPFSGWGIPVWIVIFALCIALAVLSFKYQDKIESWLVKKFKGKAKTSDGGAVTAEESELPEAEEQEIRSQDGEDGKEEKAPPDSGLPTDDGAPE